MSRLTLLQRCSEPKNEQKRVLLAVPVLVMLAPVLTLRRTMMMPRETTIVRATMVSQRELTKTLGMHPQSTARAKMPRAATTRLLVMTRPSLGVRSELAWEVPPVPPVEVQRRSLLPPQRAVRTLWNLLGNRTAAKMLIWLRTKRRKP